MGCSEGLNELFRGSLYPHKDYLDEAKKLSLLAIKLACAFGRYRRDARMAEVRRRKAEDQISQNLI